MARDVDLWAKECVACQIAKVQTHIFPPLQPILIPPHHFLTSLLIFLPRPHTFSPWLTASHDTYVGGSHPCFLSFCNNLCLCPLIRLDFPFWSSSYHTTGCSSPVTSSLWAQLSSLLNISHRTTTSFNPQSSGIVERFHYRLKTTERVCWN